MKKVLALLLLVHFICNASAQDYKTIYRDTINLHGYIYDAAGKPTVAYISSISESLNQDEQYISTFSDSTGYFELKGIRHDDTLSAETASAFIRSVPVKGARYIVLSLPANRIYDISPITITSLRKVPAQPVHIYHFKKAPPHEQAFIDFGPYNAEFAAGSMQKFQAWIVQQLIYPKQAIDNGAEGTVEVSFMINKQGFLTDAKILKSIGYGTGDEVIRIIKQSKPWKPATFHGQAFSSIYKVAVVFKLTDN